MDCKNCEENEKRIVVLEKEIERRKFISKHQNNTIETLLKQIIETSKKRTANKDEEYDCVLEMPQEN